MTGDGRPRWSQRRQRLGRWPGRRRGLEPRSGRRAHVERLLGQAQLFGGIRVRARRDSAVARLPRTQQKAGTPSYGYPQLATRLAAETGAAVFTFDFRGTGASEGDFSLGGWRADLVTAVETLRAVPGIETIWLVGFAAGATLSICAAGEDPSIGGVAAFAAPAEFLERGGDPRKFVAQARAAGVIRTRGYPPDVGAWAREWREVRPTELVAKVPPRPLLIVHGANDDIVPITDARELADAARPTAELRILAGAGHMLLHDPRAIALLLGWFDRHLGSAAVGP